MPAVTGPDRLTISTPSLRRAARQHRHGQPPHPSRTVSGRFVQSCHGFLNEEFCAEAAARKGLLAFQRLRRRAAAPKR